MDKDASHSEVHSSSLSSRSNKKLHAPAKKDDRDSGYRRNSGDHVMHRDHQRERRDEWDHRNIQRKGHRARQESVSLKQEMKKERMTITVSRDPETHSDVRVKEDVSAGSHSKGQFSKESKKDDKVRNKKNDSRNDNKEKTQKRKSPKKKKKEKKKKKKS